MSRLLLSYPKKFTRPGGVEEDYSGILNRLGRIENGRNKG